MKYLFWRLFVLLSAWSRKHACVSSLRLRNNGRRVLVQRGRHRNASWSGLAHTADVEPAGRLDARPPVQRMGAGVTVNYVYYAAGVPCRYNSVSQRRWVEATVKVVDDHGVTVTSKEDGRDRVLYYGNLENLIRPSASFSQAAPATVGAPSVKVEAQYGAHPTSPTSPATIAAPSMQAAAQYGVHLAPLLGQSGPLTMGVAGATGGTPQMSYSMPQPSPLSPQARANSAPPLGQSTPHSPQRYASASVGTHVQASSAPPLGHSTPHLPQRYAASVGPQVQANPVPPLGQSRTNSPQSFAAAVGPQVQGNSAPPLEQPKPHAQMPRSSVVMIIMPGAGYKMSRASYGILEQQYSTDLVGDSSLGSGYDRYPNPPWSPPDGTTDPLNLVSFATDLIAGRRKSNRARLPIQSAACLVFGSRGGQVVLPTFWDSDSGSSIPPQVIINGGPMLTPLQFRWPASTVSFHILCGSDPLFKTTGVPAQDFLNRVPLDAASTAVLYVELFGHNPDSSVMSKLLPEAVSAVIQWQNNDFETTKKHFVRVMDILSGYVVGKNNLFYKRSGAWMAFDRASRKWDLAKVIHPEMINLQ